MGVGYSERLMTSVSVLAGRSAVKPVAASMAATPLRMTASRASWVGTTKAPSTTDTRSSAEATVCGPGARKRWPRVSRSAVSPAYSTGITVSPKSATSQRTGRENISVVVPQRQDFGQEMPSMTPRSTSGSRAATSWEGTWRTA